MATKKPAAKATAKAATKSAVKTEAKVVKAAKPVAKKTIKPTAKKSVAPKEVKAVAKPAKPAKAKTPADIKVAVKKPEVKKVVAKPSAAIPDVPKDTIGKVRLSNVIKSPPAPTSVAKPGGGKISFAELMSKMTNNMSSAVVSGQAR